MTLQADHDSPPPQLRLDYAPRPSRGRKYFRRTAAIILVAAINFAAWRWGRPFRNRVIVLYAQHQCLTYAPPADMVVYEEDPTAAAKLLASGSEYVPYALNRSQNRLPSAAMTAAAHVPSCWPRMGTALRPWPLSPSITPAVIFLHERISSAGHRRLVCVEYFPEANTFIAALLESYNNQAFAIAPGTFNTDPIVKFAGGDVDVLSGWPSHPPNVRFYAGQPDPNDSSKFTVHYQMWGQTDVIDGQLNDNDSVKLTQRKIPEDRRN